MADLPPWPRSPLDIERAQRIAADAAEQAARIAADDAEEAARIAADNVLQAEIDAITPGPSSPAPRGNRVAFLGDSISAGVTDLAGVKTWTHAWPNVACAMSHGRMMLVLNAAISGYTTQGMLDLQLPLALAADPAVVVFLGGANDMATGLGGIAAGITVAQTRANIVAIGNAVTDTGAAFVVCGMTPRGASTGTLTVPDAHTKVQSQNAWLRRTALNTPGWIFVDLYALLVDPTTGEWAYSSDGIHPGHDTIPYIAEVVTAALDSWLPEWKPPLTEAVDDTANLIPNGLFTIDTNADGVPDGWTVAAGGTRFVVSNPDIPGAPGKALRMSPTTTGATGQVASDPFAFPGGSRVGFGFDYRQSAGLAIVAYVKLFCLDAASALVKTYVPMSAWRSKIDPIGTIYIEETIPANVTQAFVQCELANATGQVDIARLTGRVLDDPMPPPVWEP
jgi:lysophospholipase L1-like esterase